MSSITTTFRRSDQNVKTILEERFRDRISSIRNLIVSSMDKKEAIKSDRELRFYYTNRSILRRHYELNGETAPPLLLRQYNIQVDTNHTDLLEAKNNIQAEYNKFLAPLCNFTEEEIKYVIDNHISSLSILESEKTFPILCEIGGVTHTLKYAGPILSDPKGFFFTRFIIEDNIIPIFDKNFSFSTEKQRSVMLKID